MAMGFSLDPLKTTTDISPLIKINDRLLPFSAKFLGCSIENELLWYT